MADRMIVTSDHLWSQNPAAIIEEIVDGSGRDTCREVDRRIAIDKRSGPLSPAIW